MIRTKIFYKKATKLNKPILLVCLPGIGNVGSLVGEHIRNELKAEKFAVVYSPYFPHQAIMQRNGGIRLVSNRFYHFKNKKGQSILLLTGDAQASSPKGQYEVNEKIVRFFKGMGGKTAYTIGGYTVANQYVRNPKVYGVATNKKTIEELAKLGVIFGQIGGAIWGSAGMIPVLSRMHNISSACIMGETGLLEIDANAAKAVLEILKDVIKIDIKLDNIENIKRETDKIMKDMEEASQATQEAPRSHKEDYSYIR